VVARFLALLELFREGVIGFDQVDALSELNVRWLGGERTEVAVTDEFDVERAPDDDDARTNASAATDTQSNVEDTAAAEPADETLEANDD
jgi:segregation and condensation protein A